MISVGNIAVGGRAKTPMVEAVARTLIAAGERPSILSRGYGRARASDVPVVVRDAGGVRASLGESGDEPLMLAERIEGAIVVVHADRGRAGAIAEQRGATVHVLDDGFQHLQLARDLDIVMLQPSDLADEVMPAGRLREPIDALDHADAIVMVDEDEAERTYAGQAVVEIPGVRVFTAARCVAGPPADLAGHPALFVSGIAHADQAVSAVRKAGWLVAGERRFNDHHRYSAGDAASIAHAAATAGVAFVLTTAKDVVRLREVWASPLPLHVAELELAIDDRGAFDRWLIARLTQARGERAEIRMRAPRAGARHAS